MASKKSGASKGAANTSVAAATPVAAAAPAPVASAVAVTEDKVAEVAPVGEATAEAAVPAQVVIAETAVIAPQEDLSEKQDEVVAEGVNHSDAADALQALGFGGPNDGSQETSAPESDWPRTYRVTNNTRMHLCIPVHGLTVERFGAHTDIVISSEDALAGLKAEVDAIAFLNSFDDKAFLLDHVAGE